MCVIVYGSGFYFLVGIGDRVSNVGVICDSYDSFEMDERL